MKLLFILAALLLQFTYAIACENRSALLTHNFYDSLKGHDFWLPTKQLNIKQLLSARASKSEDGNNCRAKIAEAVCLVDPIPEGQAAGTPMDRPCLPGGTNYAIHFEQLYDNYPPALQKMFCSLRRIFIEKQFFGTGYAGLISDEHGTPTGGALMGIRKSVLDENLNLATWASWKEQLSFGGISDSFTLTPELPQVEVNTRAPVNDFLYFVVSHEFGHIFDFANQLNQVHDCPEDENNPDKECPVRGWASLTWQTTARALPQHEFSLRPKLCFYWCDGNPLTQSQVPLVYSSLAKTAFISTYATTQPWDDFADSLAYYLIDTYLHAKYVIDTHQGTRYDIIEKLNSPLFAAKRKYLQDFLDRADIVYP